MDTEKSPSQIRARLEAVSWDDLDRLPATRDTNFWFYSISAIHGPRLMFNVTEPLLRDARSASGKIAEIRDHMSPLDGLASALTAYDDETDVYRKMAYGEPIALAMTAYAIDKKSWFTLAGDESDDDKHILILDWKAPDGPRFCQAGFPTKRGSMPKKEDLIEVCMMLYTKNFGAAPTYNIEP